jgi:hypothetical protein
MAVDGELLVGANVIVQAFGGHCEHLSYSYQSAAPVSWCRFLWWDCGIVGLHC